MAASNSNIINHQAQAPIGFVSSDSLPVGTGGAAVGQVGNRPMTAGNEHGLVSRNGPVEAGVKPGIARPKSIHNMIGPSGVASMYNLR